MIKKGQIGDQIEDHNIGDFSIIQELLVSGFETNTRKPRFFCNSSGRSGSKGPENPGTDYQSPFISPLPLSPLITEPSPIVPTVDRSSKGIAQRVLSAVILYV